MQLKNLSHLFTAVLLFCSTANATDYYVHPELGNDFNSGTSKSNAFKSLKKLNTLELIPGDRIYLSSGFTHYGSLELNQQKGTDENIIQITSLNWEQTQDSSSARIDFKNFANGILLEDCSNISISNITITGNGYENTPSTSSMNCGVLILNNRPLSLSNITLTNLNIHDVYYENKGFVRGQEEVKTANGTQSYGWGIRVISTNLKGIIEMITISECNIKDVSHTGIKLTGKNQNIRDITLLRNTVSNTGGPGIQMSLVKNVLVRENTVTHSGSDDDGRKWGRGSGLWTWGSSQVLIEKNKFLYANGPGDSAGAHIDFNCDNIILQYNISAYNAGGFCEILGNNYNCAYRYNLSVNDGNRSKGKDGAFQEGKIFWLSGYQGNDKPRKGPVNTYFYNNTIYSDGSYTPKIAIEKSSNGILIANNIFYIKGKTEMVLGDQYKPEKEWGTTAANVIFDTNLFYSRKSWPQKISFKDSNPIYGDPGIADDGKINIDSYIPSNKKLVTLKTKEINKILNDTIGLFLGLELEKDLLGNEISFPFLGAIQPN